MAPQGLKLAEPGRSERTGGLRPFSDAVRLVGTVVRTLNQRVLASDS